MNRTALGVFASAGQVVLTGGLLFALYAYARTALGLEVFGVWSVVAGTAVSAQIAGLGLAGSAVKFVASALAREAPDEGARVAETTLLSITVLVGLAALMLYPLLSRLLSVIIVDPDLLVQGQMLLPYALVSLWLGAISSALQACLDGASAVHWRAGVASIGSVLFLAFTILLTPHFGLRGLAWAQVAQSAATVGIGWVLLHRVLPGLRYFWLRLDGALLRKMLGYGLSFQAISVLFLLLDPVAKALMMRFGGAAWAGNFELANKLALQLRNVIVMGQQALVPMLASLHERAPEHIRLLYERSLRAVLILVCIAIPASITTMPLVALMWLGHIDWTFVVLLDLLLLAWLANALSGPAYFVHLGTGALRWNVVGHLVMGCINLVGGGILGGIFGGLAVAAAYAAAVVLGSAVPVWMYHREAGMRIRSAFNHSDTRIGAETLLLTLLAGGLAPLFVAQGRPYLVLMLLLACGVWAMYRLWHHPFRREVQRFTYSHPTL